MLFCRTDDITIDDNDEDDDEDLFDTNSDVHWSIFLVSKRTSKSIIIVIYIDSHKNTRIISFSRIYLKKYLIRYFKKSYSSMLEKVALLFKFASNKSNSLGCFSS